MINTRDVQQFINSHKTLFKTKDHQQKIDEGSIKLTGKKDKGLDE